MIGLIPNDATTAIWENVTHGRRCLDGPSPGVTLGGDLERRRLEHRTKRLRLVIAVLRERTTTSSRARAISPGLQQAITDFSAELARVRRRLHGEPAHEELTRVTTSHESHHQGLQVASGSSVKRR
jgi:hypothetical protein